MSCVPAFSPGLDFDCVKDIIADVRSGSVGVATVQKALWVAGNASAFFQPPVIGSSGDLSLEEVADELDKAMAFKSNEPAKVDPATVILVLQLVWKIVQQFIKK